jgi:outer membrane protein assembly factor BamB
MDSPVGEPILLLKRAENLQSDAGRRAFEEINGGGAIADSPVSLRRSLSESIKRRFGFGTQKDERLNRRRTVGASTISGKAGSNPSQSRVIPGQHFRSLSDSVGVWSVKEDTPEDDNYAIDAPVPASLLQGIVMTRVTNNGSTNEVFRLDPDLGQIIWESKKHRISTFMAFRLLDPS